MSDKLKLVNCRENNLKGLSLELPHDKVVVLTGPSGSGKSSLAFSTIFAEGQQSYIETFSPYVRQFFSQLKKPEVDLVENIRPSIAVQQKTKIFSSRSTVGSLTDINELLKFLWAYASKPYCPLCSSLLLGTSPSSLSVVVKEKALYLKAANILITVEPENFKKKRLLREEILRFQLLGFARYFVPQEKKFLKINTSDKFTLPNTKFYLVIDRFHISDIEKDLERVKESLASAFSFSPKINLFFLREDLLVIEEKEYKKGYICSNTKCTLEPLNFSVPHPSFFSEQSPLGACPVCDGFGAVLEPSVRRIVPDDNLGIDEGAVKCWRTPSFSHWQTKLHNYCIRKDIRVFKPWRQLAEEYKKSILYGDKKFGFKGVIPWLKSLEKKSYKKHIRIFLSKYYEPVECLECKGNRVRKEALLFKIKGLSIADLRNLPVEQCLKWIKEIEQLEEFNHIKDLITNIQSRLNWLNDLGLPFLTLNRASATLSGGETQRVNLASLLGSGLTSVQFVLDEPSVGLHPRDNEKLAGVIRELQLKGNSVLVVEHDLDLISASDYLVELGPKAGKYGGEIVYQGEFSKWKGRESFEELKEKVVKSAKLKRKKKKTSHCITVKNASARNLKGINVELPLNRFIALTGVSGSGKSTFAELILRDGWEHYRAHKKDYTDNSKVVLKKEDGCFAEIEGFNRIQRLSLVEQKPIAKSPRSNIATLLGVWSYIREILSETKDAQERSLTPAHFSFNTDEGACPTCDGAGVIKEQMEFMNDIYVQCPLCLGNRFRERVLEVRFKGKNASDILKLTVAEAIDFFKDHPRIVRALEPLKPLGLDYVTLGHPLSELSGGESQRLKLVSYLYHIIGDEKGSFLILDEPSVGLHLFDVVNLINLLRELVAAGHTVLVIEHNPFVILSADYVIDLGPEGGDKGGEVVKEGIPKEFLSADNNTKSFTAKYLQQFAKTSFLKSSFKVSPIQTRDHSSLIIKEAREHNLKNINLALPHNSIVVLTGLSGSGKSTVAKDIIFSEGQRRFLDCLSPYARQFIKQLKKPEVKEILNLRPTICVEQHKFKPSRGGSIVATLSDVSPFLRLLFAKIGTQYCPEHPKEEIKSLSAKDLVYIIKQQYKEEVIRIMAPIVNMRKGTHKEVFVRGINLGFSEAYVDGVFGRMENFLTGLKRTVPHTIHYVVAKISPERVPADLLEEVISQALQLGEGSLIIAGKDLKVFSTVRACPVCRRGFLNLAAEDFSFSSKRGQCIACEGRGVDERGRTCKECKGTRLKKVPSLVRIEGKNISECFKLTPLSLIPFLEAVLKKEKEKKEVAKVIIQEAVSRLNTLVELGLDYLPLDREGASLSTGELQRLKLASVINSNLSGVFYIFDEPSVGLHPLDNLKVIKKFKTLKIKVKLKKELQ